MNKKLIAVAISATLAAPVVANAEDGDKSVTVYGRINNALAFTDVEGAEKTTDLSNVSSRFGFKASADIGNGLTATGRYEFATTTDKEQNNISDLRIGTVGISGGFGSVTAGNQWSAYYNTVGTHLDPTYSLGYYLYSSLASGPYRSSNTIKYANDFGPVHLELDYRANDSSEGNDVAEKLAGNGVGIGLSIAATENLTFAVAHDREDRDDLTTDPGSADMSRTAAAIKGTFGSFWGTLAYQNAEDKLTDTEVEQTQLWLGTKFGEKTSALLGLGEIDAGGSASPTAINLGVYHNIGGGLKLYYEGVSLDDDNATDVSSVDKHLLGMRIDF